MALKKFIGIYKYYDDGEIYMVKGYYRDRFEAYRDMFIKGTDLIVLAEDEVELLCLHASDKGVPTYQEVRISEGLWDT